MQRSRGKHLTFFLQTPVEVKAHHFGSLRLLSFLNDLSCLPFEMGTRDSTRCNVVALRLTQGYAKFGDPQLADSSKVVTVSYRWEGLLAANKLMIYIHRSETGAEGLRPFR
jgi:hypothetical protein